MRPPARDPRAPDARVYCDAVLLRWLVVAGVGITAVALLTGTLAPADLAALGTRLAPILVFVVAMTVVAELASIAGVFDVLARAVAHGGRGRTWVLWLLVVALATITTVFLSLDTTAVLLTPVVVVLARSCGLATVPFALSTVWLANTASMLLPVSNLSNLLAQQRLELHTHDFVALTWAPAIVGVVVPTAVLAVVFRRRLADGYRLPPDPAIEDPVLLRGSAIVLALLLPALVVGVPVWLPATIAALVLVVLFAVRRRRSLRWRLLPAVPVVLTMSLFVLVSALHAVGLTDLLLAVAGDGDDLPGLLRLAGAATVTANLVNNLPAYLAFEPVAGDTTRLMATLVATNMGPLITPFASLATLLWFDRLRAMRVHVDWRGFALLGAVVVPLTVGLGVLALWLTT